MYAAARLLPADTRARLVEGAGPDTLARQHTALIGMDLGRLRELRGVLTERADWSALSGRLGDALPPTVRRHLPALAAHGAFDDADLRELASFRDEIDGAIELADRLPAGLRSRFGPALAGVRTRLSRATSEQLFILREELDPAALRSSVETVAVLAGLPPSPAQAAELEAWRDTTVRFYRDLAQADPSSPAEAAALAVERAAPSRLLLMQAALSPPPPDPIALFGLPIAIERLPDATLQQALVNLNCVVELGSISIFGATIDLGQINLNWICTPLENAINGLEGAVNAVSSVVDDVVETITSLPEEIASAFQSFFTVLAQGALATFSAENLQGVLGLFGNYWEQLPPIPEGIPCPDLGTDIPFFGIVGDEGTAPRYRRHLWVFDKVLEMIPDTEMSLTLKIPAQVLYGSVQYLSVCLDQAEERRKESEHKARHGDLVAGFETATSKLAELTGQLGAVGGEMAARFDGIAALQSALAIEAALADAGSGGLIRPPRIASFQLPAAVGGAIELVRDVVADVIASTQAAGEDVHCAPDELGRGDVAYAAGRYKAAFDSFRRAYQEAARTGAPGCGQTLTSHEPR
jgi:hypothetical protein